MPCGNVVVLSESDEDREKLIPDPPALARPRPKRKRISGLTSQDDSEKRLRSILGRRCKCKRRDCFREFAGADDFSKLLSYRTTYFALHKLDQDHFVPWRQFVQIWDSLLSFRLVVLASASHVLLQLPIRACNSGSRCCTRFVTFCGQQMSSRMSHGSFWTAKFVCVLGRHCMAWAAGLHDVSSERACWPFIFIGWLTINLQTTWVRIHVCSNDHLQTLVQPFGATQHCVIEWSQTVVL